MGAKVIHKLLKIKLIVDIIIHLLLKYVKTQQIMYIKLKKDV